MMIGFLVFSVMLGPHYDALSTAWREAMDRARYDLKAFAIDADVDHGHLSKAISGEKNFTFPMASHAEVAVLQHFAIALLGKVGFPAEVETAIKAKHVMLRMNFAPSRRDEAAS